MAYIPKYLHTSYWSRVSYIFDTEVFSTLQQVSMELFYIQFLPNLIIFLSLSWINVYYMHFDILFIVNVVEAVHTKETKWPSLELQYGQLLHY